ncbi:MAG TPA: PDR/VanB family oxidoreductase [Pseudonocardiaceae bacterium]|nr:PDR/VanB family oxidoreductase [Pseudonocardiaceae bacterium]
MTESTLDVVVDRRERLASHVIGLVLRRPDGAAMPEWTPGAHVDLLLGNGMTRQFSLCGDPADRATLRVAVLREPAGRGGSAYVHDEVVESTRLRIRGPRNHFPLAPARRYLFIAGGIGITPILPMLGAVEPGIDWRLVYGGRTRESMAFRDELARYGDRVRLRPQDECGLLDVAGLAAEPAEIYCCGPEPLLAAVTAVAPAAHVERFTPVADTGDSRPIEVELARSGRTVLVPAGCSVLAAVEAAGVAVLSSCREGTCGTCETDVLDGVPDHRDSLLTDAERAAGDTMLICVSRAAGDRLVLDL